MSGGVVGGRGLSSGMTALVVAAGLVIGGTTSAVGVALTSAVVLGAGSSHGSGAGADLTAPHVAQPPPSTVPTSAPTASPAPPTPSPTPTATPTRTPTPTQRATPTKGAAASSAGLVAVVGVVDGDTIKVRLGGVTERVRVIGIDTPELASGECYAQQASSRMQSLVQSRTVRLVRDPSQGDRDRYDRLLRHVQLTDGRQVAHVLIAGGFGEEYTHDRAYAGQAAYRAAERAAREAGKGIWGSGCLAPPPAAPGSCDIKGNISSSGEKIYHVPGQRYYEVTKIDEAKGERWFCSEADAVAAGWRKAKV